MIGILELSSMNDSMFRLDWTIDIWMHRIVTKEFSSLFFVDHFASDKHESAIEGTKQLSLLHWPRFFPCCTSYSKRFSLELSWAKRLLWEFSWWVAFLCTFWTCSCWNFRCIHVYMYSIMYVHIHISYMFTCIYSWYELFQTCLKRPSLVSTI